MANVNTSIDIAAPVERVCGTRFCYENQFELPAGELGDTASRVVSGYAEQEANDSLASLKHLAEG
jgi:hypothetical protein